MDYKRLQTRDCLSVILQFFLKLNWKAYKDIEWP